MYLGLATFGYLIGKALSYSTRLLSNLASGRGHVYDLSDDDAPDPSATKNILPDIKLTLSNLENCSDDSSAEVLLILYLDRVNSNRRTPEVSAIRARKWFAEVRRRVATRISILVDRFLKMGDRRRYGDYVWDILLFAGMMTAGAMAVKHFLGPLVANLVDPESEKHEQAKRKAEAHLERLNRRKRKENVADGESIDSTRRRVDELALNEYESLVALEMVAPEDIHVGFNDIGGLDTTIEELKESVIYPLTMPHLYSHATPLLAAPSGVLLFGPPGCGKTMLAKAVAHESGASFINLHISTLTEKWYGDSNKMVRAVFSLARKMQPAIIFIDEIDAVMGTRRSGEHEASGMVKAEFMTLWDGLTSANASGTPAQIVVLGATNRINDIDEAILRRMPKKFPVPLPGLEQRRRILQLILDGAKMDLQNFNIDYVAKVTKGMSGSDIKEACRDAAMAPVREYMRKHADEAKERRPVDPTHFRGIRTDDFFGTKGGQLVVDKSVRVKQSNKGRNRESSSDEYEDTDELVVEAQD